MVETLFKNCSFNEKDQTITLYSDVIVCHLLHFLAVAEYYYYYTSNGENLHGKQSLTNSNSDLPSSGICSLVIGLSC